MSKYRVSYAQNREDIILSGFFEGLEKGFYVDVGANHPDLLSITKIFYDSGWNGINIEPNKQLFNLIQQSRSRDINLNLGAADAQGELTLREYPEGDGLSTFSKTAQKNYEKNSSEYREYTRNHKDYKVKVEPLSQILHYHSTQQINFMNIDVEGFEYEVIKGNDWNKYRPQVLCIEANHIIKDWRPLLKEAGYKLTFFDGLNNYYVAQEHSEIAKNFSYVKTILLGKPIIQANLQKTLVEAEQGKIKLENQLIRQRLIEDKLRTEIHNLYVQQQANSRLRALIKQIAIRLNAAILVQIEKLNKPKVANQKPLQLSNEIGLTELLLSIKKYDLERYYNAETSARISYRFIYGIYTRVYATLSTLIRKFVRGLRRLKNG